MKKINLLLILIIIAGGLVRLFGINSATYFIDEETLLNRAFSVFLGKELFNPHFVENGIAYGMIISYFHAFVMSLIYFFGHLFLHWQSSDLVYPILKLSTRIMSVVFGMGSVFLVYLIAKKFFNQKIGLLSALVLAFSFNHVVQSKFSLVDIYISFFLALSLYYSFEIAFSQKLQVKPFLLVGLATGLNFALKYNVCFFSPVIVAIVLNYFRNNKNFHLRLFLRFFVKPGPLLSLSSAVLTFIVVNPYLLINPYGFIFQLKSILSTAWNFPYGGRDLDNVSNFLWYLDYLARVGLYYPFFIFTVGGMVIAFFKEQPKVLLLLSYPLTQFLLFEFFTPRADRYTIWWSSMFAIFAGFFLSSSFDFFRSLEKRFKLLSRALSFLVVFLLAVSILRVIIVNFALIIFKETRVTASEFFNSHPRPLYFIVDTDFKIGGAKEPIFLNDHSLRQLAFNPQSSSPLNLYRYPDEYVMLTSFIYDDYLYLDKKNPERKVFFLKPRWSYELLSSYLTEMDFMTNFMKNARLVKEYSNSIFNNSVINNLRILGGGTDFGLSYNPTIKIYKIPKPSHSLPKIYSTYYPSDSASNINLLKSDCKGEKIVKDEISNKVFLVLNNDLKDCGPAIFSPRSPFPSGDYIVKLYFKIGRENKGVVLKNPLNIYGYVTFGDQTLSGNISRRNIEKKMIRQANEHQVVDLGFHLIQTTVTRIELYWLENSPLYLEKIEIKGLDEN